MRKVLLFLLILFCSVNCRAQSNAFAVQPLTGERVQVVGGTIFTGNANVAIPNTIFSLTDGATNSIYITNLGALVISTSGFAGNFPIATVVTSNGNIVSITDNRANAVVGGIGGTLPVGTTVSGSDITFPGKITAGTLQIPSYISIPTSDLFIGTTGGAAGNASITGSQSVGVGQGALVNMTGPASGGTDSKNTAIGYNACNALTTGRFTVCVGARAGESLTGNGQGVEDIVSTLIGVQAGLNLVGSVAGVTHFVCVGEDSCIDLTGGGNSVMIGDHSGNGVSSANTTVIVGNSSAGTGAVNTMTTLNEVIEGYSAALSGTGAFSDDVIIGANAADSTTATSSEVIIGSKAAHTQTTGSNNVCIGYEACYLSVIGSSNTSVGYKAGYNHTGYNLSAVGNQACLNANGSGGNTGNSCLGANTNLNAVGDSNETVLGQGATGAGSNTVTIGNASVTDVWEGGATALAKEHAAAYLTSTNCSSSASPAVCGSAAAGSVAVPTGVTPTLVVNTTAVTANSQILFTPDEGLGTKLGVTCNSTIAQVAIEPIVTARTAATSFTITYNTTVTTNPICLSYLIVN